MRSGNLFVMVICLLFLFKGSGVHAMFNCQSQQHQQSSIKLDALTDQNSFASHHHSSSDATDTSQSMPSDSKVDNEHVGSAEPCEGCNDCCSIQCVLLPRLSVATEISCHDKVLQNTYLQTTGMILPQERPPKTV